jgi:putative protein-disulfide isomerase
MPSLIFVADPMCSWCYGFTPELSTLLQGIPDLPLEIIVGGLRAYNRQTLEAEQKATILAHWQQVAKASGLPFNDAALSRPDFVYDSEPACRAVVTARTLSPSNTLYVFHAIQHAFYAEGKDVTQAEILAEVAADALTAAGVPTAPAAFRAAWESQESVLATAEDFGQTRRWEISGFPTLILERDGVLDLVTSGYINAEQLVKRMQSIVDQAEAVMQD